LQFVQQTSRLLKVTRQLVHVKARRAKGLCAFEGCPKVTGDRYRCDEHAKAHAAAVLLWRGKRTAKEASK